MNYLMRRSFYTYARNRSLVLSELLLYMLTAFAGGTIYYDVAKWRDGSCVYSQRSGETLVYAIFYAIANIIIISMLNAIMVKLTVNHSFRTYNT